MAEEILSFEVLPCGCTTEGVIVDGVKTLKYVPCSQDCPFFRFAIGRVQQQGKKVEYRTDLP